MSEEPIGITEHGDMVYPWPSCAPEARVEEGGPGSGACPDEPGIRSHPQGIGTPPVEDSHANLAAEMLQCDEAELPYQVCKWAARIEQLGLAKVVCIGPPTLERLARYEPVEIGNNVTLLAADGLRELLERGRVEEKKAAELLADLKRALEGVSMPFHLHKPIREGLAAIEAALVEAEKESGT